MNKSTSTRTLLNNVHQGIPMTDKGLLTQALRQGISVLLFCGNINHLDYAVLRKSSNKMMPNMDVT